MAATCDFVNNLLDANANNRRCAGAFAPRGLIFMAVRSREDVAASILNMSSII